ncbi:MAG: metalloregulator ArsR/SmtB family transcription factor [Cyanobacteria bacterium J06634_6]
MRSTVIPAETAVSHGCHSLSEPIRLEILELLNQGEKRPMEMEEELGISQSKLGFHLDTLKKSGLIKSRRAYRASYYWRDEGAIAALKQLVQEI